MNIFDSSFRIGTTVASQQVGLHTSVSPDDGNGARMSYLRFEDHADGVTSTSTTSTTRARSAPCRTSTRSPSRV